MRQAIEEGFILDVLANYTTYATYWRLAKAGRATTPRYDAGKAAARDRPLRVAAPHNLAQKAEIIVEHFRAAHRHKIGGQGQGDGGHRVRLHAVRYKQAIDKYIAAQGLRRTSNALVAFSGTVDDPEHPSVELHRGRA